MDYTVGKKRSEHWIIDETSLRYYLNKGTYIPKIELNIEVNIKDIQYIEIYFTSRFAGMPAQRGLPSMHHPLYFDIYLKDGKKKTFPILTNRDRNEVIYAIQYIRDLGIEIKDKHDLISYINDKNANIWQSVENIIHENNLPYTMKKL